MSDQVLTGTDDSDLIEGTTSDDKINGGDEGDVLLAGDGDDKVNAGDGDDLIEGGAGDDYINGGDGFDIAYYDGEVQVYVNDDGVLELSDGKGNTIILDAGDDGTDILRNIEAIQFTNYTFYLDGRNNAVLAVDDAASTDEDTSLLNIDVLSNDLDLDGDTLSVTGLDTSGSTGLFTLNLDGSINYDPNGGFEYLAIGESATDSVIYTVTDGNGSVVTGTLTLTVDGVNDAPVAADDAATTDEDTSVFGNVLTNDSDVDASDTLTVTPQTDVAGDNGGTFTLLADGSFTFDPSSDFQTLALGESLTSSISYDISDGNGGTSTAILSVLVNGVNDMPVAMDDLATTDEDTVVSGNVLINDSDVDASDILTVTPQTDVAGDNGGTFTLLADGSFTFDPSEDFQALNDGESFTTSVVYEVVDGNGGAATATLSIEVLGVTDTAPSDATITFDSLIGFEDYNNGVPFSYDEAGFSFTATGNHVDGTGVLSWHDGGYNAGDNDITMTAGGETFDLLSLDIIYNSGFSIVTDNGSWSSGGLTGTDVEVNLTGITWATFETSSTSSIDNIDVSFGLPDHYEGSLNAGESGSGFVSSSGYWYDPSPTTSDYWQVSGDAGDTITITVERTELNYDPAFWIVEGTIEDPSTYFSGGSNAGIDYSDPGVVNFSDDEIYSPGPYGDPHETFTLAADGEYTVIVTNYASGSDGGDGLFSYDIFVA
ncbi:Ig-like domain-containing protein [Neptuniibacter sp. QD48_55]|uniref:Ig-like domain-containing protein n=1 Tax=unclassified Neptuniibacter TaxID=2630693 RepID=UPI0039F46557